MVGSVTVQWCPHCKSWGKSERLAVDISTGFVGNEDREGSPFEYVREGHRCESCEGDFVVTRLKNCKPNYRWSVARELARIRRALPGYHGSHDANGPRTWEHHHPELADFSAAVQPDAATA